MSTALVSRLTADTLRQIAPRPGPASEWARITAALGPALPAVLPDYGIGTPLRIAHFLAQAAHETNGFRTLEEYGGASYFARYEGRADLGNTKPGDGARFHGRGIFQLTGRANYRRYGEKLGLDLEGDPERAAEPVISLKIAACYWADRKLNAPADQDDLLRVTLLINGGRNGLDDRRVKLGRARTAIAALAALDVPAADPEHYPTLRRGSEGDAVEVLQVRLRKSGFELTVDGAFGPATETAVRTFQRGRGLTVDGIVGPKSWAAIIPQET